MKSFSLAVLGLIGAAIACAPSAATSDSLNSASALLAEARRAAGGTAWDQKGALAFRARETNAGMAGQTRVVIDLERGRLRRESDFQIVRTLDIYDGAGHWQQDVSGGVHRLDSDFAGAAITTESWLARRAYLTPGAGGAVLSVLAPQRDGGVACQVVRAVPVNGQPVDLWFAEATHLLVRIERKMPITIKTVRLSDYRPFNGLQLPYRIDEDEGIAGGEVRVEIDDYERGAIDATAFAKPSRPDDTTVVGGAVTAPIELDGYITVEATINGHGPLAFLFDTGGHDILTPEAASALGLQPAGVGTSGGAGAGQLPVQYVNVDRLQIGGVEIRDQHFFTIPLQYNTVERGSRPPFAGILGLELLERMAMRIDYGTKTMTFWPLGSYRHDGPGEALPIAFTEDIPLVRGTLNGAAGDFAVDTGNGGSTVVQHVWAERNGLAGRLKAGVRMFSFGTGGRSENWASRLPTLGIGSTTFRNHVGRYAEDTRGAFSSRTEAANIGTEILANFVVDFDYERGQMWLAPSSGYAPPPFPRSGMSLAKNSPDRFTVVNVLENGPAAQAGIHEGDALLAVAGRTARDLSKRDLLRLFTQAPGTKVMVRTVRDGHSSSGTLVLRELLP